MKGKLLISDGCLVDACGTLAVACGHPPAGSGLLAGTGSRLLSLGWRRRQEYGWAAGESGMGCKLAITIVHLKTAGHCMLAPQSKLVVAWQMLMVGSGSLAGNDRHLLVLDRQKSRKRDGGKQATLNVPLQGTGCHMFAPSINSPEKHR